LFLKRLFNAGFDSITSRLEESEGGVGGLFSIKINPGIVKNSESINSKNIRLKLSSLPFEYCPSYPSYSVLYPLKNNPGIRIAPTTATCDKHELY